MALASLAAAALTSAPLPAQPAPIRVEAPDPKAKPYLVAPGTHYWWLDGGQGNVPGADRRLCSGEGDDASPEKLCGASGVYLGRCGSGAAYGVRGILMPRRTPAEMQIVTADAAGGKARLACARVADRATAQALAARVAGRAQPADAPGLGDALAACAIAARASCRLAWYGFEPLGGPGSVSAATNYPADGTYRTSAQSDAEVAKRAAESAASVAEAIERARRRR